MEARQIARRLSGSVKSRSLRRVRWLAYVSGASTLLATRQTAMRVIAFHGVGGLGTSDVDYPAREFEKHLKYLAAHFSIVSLETLLRTLDGRRRSNGHEVVLTFDDGLRNHSTVVYSILRRLRVPATFFVCPGLIDSGRWQWAHEALARLQSLSLPRRAAFARELRTPATEAEAIVEWMKSLSRGSRDSVDAAIRETTPDFEPTRTQRDDFDVMTWDELSAISPEIVTIGSHTVSHPILTDLDPGDLQHEIQASRQWLEDRLQRPVEHFCYPNGSHNPAVVACVRAVYRSAVTTVDGAVAPGDDPYRLRRITAGQRLPLMAWRMHRPGS